MHNTLIHQTLFVHYFLSQISLTQVDTQTMNTICLNQLVNHEQLAGSAFQYAEIYQLTP